MKSPINTIEIDTRLTDFSEFQLQILYNSIMAYEDSRLELERIRTKTWQACGLEYTRCEFLQKELDEIAIVKTQVLNAIGLVGLMNTTISN